MFNWYVRGGGILFFLFKVVMEIKKSFLMGGNFDYEKNYVFEKCMENCKLI